MVGATPEGPGLGKTQCDTDNRVCRGSAFPISADWITQFVLKDPNADISAISESQYFSILDRSRQEYFSLIDTAQADLREFQQHGGKMIAWHGLADQLIPPNGTVQYYDRVLEISPDAQDFFRFFQIPGVQHCQGGPGAFPGDAFTRLVDWVEQGIVPETLRGQVSDGSQVGKDKFRVYCPYPRTAMIETTDPDRLDFHECTSEGSAAVTGHEEL